MGICRFYSNGHNPGTALAFYGTGTRFQLQHCMSTQAVELTAQQGPVRRTKVALYIIRIIRIMYNTNYVLSIRIIHNIVYTKWPDLEYKGQYNYTFLFYSIRIVNIIL